MKRSLHFTGVLLIIILIGACSSERMDFNKLQDRNGLLYLINQDKPFSGDVISYSMGKVDFEGKVNNGLREGQWTYFFPNGQKKTEGSYKDGLKEGNWTYWKENGAQDKLEVYKYGKLLTNEGTPEEPKKDSVKVITVEKEVVKAPTPPKEVKKVEKKQEAVVWERLHGGPVKYLDGIPYSGPVVKYYREGGKEFEGYFSRGHRSGKWIFYDRRSNVKDVKYY